jgi:thiol:disulfide interchange protein
MKTSTLRGWGMAGTFAMVVAAGCAQPKHPAASSQQAIAWNTTYDAALADAGRTGRPILLDFYTDW